MLRMFCNGCSSVERVGSDSIYSSISRRVVKGATMHEVPREGSIYHLDGGIGQVDELGKDFAVLAGGIELGSIP